MPNGPRSVLEVPDMDRAVPAYYAPPAMITPAQVRGARAMLRIGVAELAEAAGVGTTTIKRYEAADELPAAGIRTVAALRAALERMGCEFPDPYTVRLRPEAIEAQRRRRRR